MPRLRVGPLWPGSVQAWISLWVWGGFPQIGPVEFAMNTQRILCLTPRCPKLFQMCLTMSAPSLRTPACRFGYSVLLQLWLAQIECSTLFEKSAAASKLQWNTNMINIKHTCSSYAFEILWMLFARRNSGSEPAGSIDHPAGRIAYQHCFPTGSKHVGVVWHYFFLKNSPRTWIKTLLIPCCCFESRDGWCSASISR